MKTNRAYLFSPNRAFTLIELLVVIAIIAILAAMLLPALGRAKQRANIAYCINGQKQMAIAWVMYADDNSEVMPLNQWDHGGPARSTTGSWVTGNANVDADPASITRGTLFQYVKAIGTYRCTEDKAYMQGTGISRYRCFSMSCYLNGDAASEAAGGFKHRSKLSSLKRTSSIMVFIDEDDRSLDDGHFLYPWSKTAPNGLAWINYPGFRHSNGTVWSFADGHAEYHKWKTSYRALSSAFTPTFGSEQNDVVALEETSPENPVNQ